MTKLFYYLWSAIAFIGMIIEVIWFLGGTGIVLNSV